MVTLQEHDAWVEGQEERIRDLDLADHHLASLQRTNNAIRNLILAEDCWALQDDRTFLERAFDWFTGHDAYEDVMRCLQSQEEIRKW